MQNQIHIIKLEEKHLLECFACGGNGNINVCFSSALYLGDHFAGGWIDRRECFTTLAFVPFVVDKQL